jgi:hypothetical protein
MLVDEGCLDDFSDEVAKDRDVVGRALVVC